MKRSIPSIFFLIGYYNNSRGRQMHLIGLSGTLTQVMLLDLGVPKIIFSRARVHHCCCTEIMLSMQNLIRKIIILGFHIAVRQLSHIIIFQNLFAFTISAYFISPLFQIQKDLDIFRQGPLDNKVLFFSNTALFALMLWRDPFQVKSIFGAFSEMSIYYVCIVWSKKKLIVVTFLIEIFYQKFLLSFSPFDLWN